MRQTADLTPERGLHAPLPSPVQAAPSPPHNWRLWRETERLYDFIPDALWPELRLGSAEAASRIRAAGEARFFQSMVKGQIRTIRRRRAEGSFYPALLTDLALYWQGWRRWSAVRRQLSLSETTSPSPSQEETP